jgi:hypothetical protein
VQRSVEERHVVFGVGEELLELSLERGVPAAQLREPGNALLRRDIEQLVQ